MTDYRITRFFGGSNAQMKPSSRSGPSVSLEQGNTTKAPLSHLQSRGEVLDMLRTAQDTVEIYYVPCPNVRDHWILFDPEAPLESKLIPGAKISVTTCTLCGPGPDGHGTQVMPNAPLKFGWVTVEEQRQLWALNEPRPKDH